jgi:hypothetical protein
MNRRLYLLLFALLGHRPDGLRMACSTVRKSLQSHGIVFGPFAAVMFGTLGLFPSLAGEVGPAEKSKRAVQGVVLLFGIAAGILNWYALTHF